MRFAKKIAVVLGFIIAVSALFLILSIAGTIYFTLVALLMAFCLIFKRDRAAVIWESIVKDFLEYSKKILKILKEIFHDFKTLYQLASAVKAK